MGVLTTLNAITLTQNEQNVGAVNAKDVAGLLNVSQIKADDLLANMKAILNALPVGDPAIAQVNTIITSLT